MSKSWFLFSQSYNNWKKNLQCLVHNWIRKNLAQQNFISINNSSIKSKALKTFIQYRLTTCSLFACGFLITGLLNGLFRFIFSCGRTLVRNSGADSDVSKLTSTVTSFVVVEYNLANFEISRWCSSVSITKKMSKHSQFQDGTYFWIKTSCLNKNFLFE